MHRASGGSGSEKALLIVSKVEKARESSEERGGHEKRTSSIDAGSSRMAGPSWELKADALVVKKSVLLVPRCIGLPG